MTPCLYPDCKNPAQPGQPVCKQHASVIERSLAGVNPEEDPPETVPVAPAEGKTLNWHRLRTGEMIGSYGAEIVMVVQKAQGFPCEAYTYHATQALYHTLEAAQQGAEKFFTQHFMPDDWARPERPLEAIMVALEPAIQALAEREREIAAYDAKFEEAERALPAALNENAYNVGISKIIDKLGPRPRPLRYMEVLGPVAQAMIASYKQNQGAMKAIEQRLKAATGGEPR